MVRKGIKRWLGRFGLYDRLKYSTVFYWYEKLFKPAVIKQQRREVEFYRSFLQPCDLIFDIGANDGHKTAAFLHMASRVVCCEPDERSHQILMTRFRSYKKRVYIERKAVGSYEGSAKMFRHHEGSAFNTLNPKFRDITERDQLQKWNEIIRFREQVEVEITTLEALIRKYGAPYFIKVDVEGYELEVVKGLKQCVPFISIECLLPDFKNELEEILSGLLQLAPNSSFNVAVNEKLLFPAFISYPKLREFIDSYDQHHFETIIKMQV